MASTAAASSSVHQTVAALRSQIFQTAHNPSQLRTGAKFLRKHLRGPAVLAYITPSINSPTMSQYTSVKRILGDRDFRLQMMSPTDYPRPTKGQFMVKDSEDAPARLAGEAYRRAVRQYERSAASRGVVPPGWEEVESSAIGDDGDVPGNASKGRWLVDEHGEVRRREVAVKRLEGRGPPKKGQGKRSQMKKK